MGEFLSSFASFFFPVRCPCCGKVSSVYEPCKECADALDLVRIKGTSCFRCGEPIIECHCRGFNPLYAGIVAPFKRNGVAKDAIYALKFKSRFYPAEYFGCEMAAEFKRRCPDVKVDIVCVVPMTRKERADKPCDQVAELARYVVKSFDASYEPKLIKKVRETKRQRDLELKERAANIKDAFRVDKRLNGETVLLLDDIKTSGYTLNECAKQLRLQGAKEVWCLTSLVTPFSSCKDDKIDV